MPTFANHGNENRIVWTQLVHQGAQRFHHALVKVGERRVGQNARQRVDDARCIVGNVQFATKAAQCANGSATSLAQKEIGW